MFIILCFDRLLILLQTLPNKSLSYLEQIYFHAYFVDNRIFFNSGVMESFRAKKKALLSKFMLYEMCLCVISFTVYVILLSLCANYAKFPLFTRHFVNTNKEFMFCTIILLNILDGYDMMLLT